VAKDPLVGDDVGVLRRRHYRTHDHCHTV
jgi:hypothetical protein